MFVPLTGSISNAFHTSAGVSVRALRLFTCWIAVRISCFVGTACGTLAGVGACSILSIIVSSMPVVWYNSSAYSVRICARSFGSVAALYPVQ